MTDREGSHIELCRQRDAGLAVDPEVARSVRAYYLVRIRGRLQYDEAANRTAAEASPATEAFEPLRGMMKDIVREGTEDYFDAALMSVLEELGKLRQMEPARYILDPESGELVAPLTEETVYTPDQSMREGPNGELVPAANPIKAVHPAITTGLALMQAERHRMERVQRLAADPVKGMAYRHLTEPQRIVEIARERLEKVGVSTAELGTEQEDTVLEFGRESIEADLQSTNTSFHRLAMYPAIIATHVLRMCGAGGHCWIGPVRLQKSSRERWYSVAVKARRALELS